jgi:hypothetical protein
MGTRSTTKFFDGEHCVCSIYQQYDGYISGVGHDLANWLKDKKIVNGYNSEMTMESGFANGMGCLAAQYVASQKAKIGGFYMTTPDDIQGYDYEVRFVDGKIQIKVDKFVGTPEELLVYDESDGED